MLSKPMHGWTDFFLGEDVYSLSYLTDIPMDWLDRAMIGMKEKAPFSVHGFCEPGWMECVVSLDSCRIVFTNGNKPAFSTDNSAGDVYEIGMREFCKALYQDIRDNLEAWSSWQREDDPRDKAAQLQAKLDVLKKLL